MTGIPSAGSTTSFRAKLWKAPSRPRRQTAGSPLSPPSTRATTGRIRVVAWNPVAQGLPVHATELAGFAPLISFKHQGQRQHPPCCIGVIAVCRRLAKIRRRVIVARMSKLSASESPRIIAEAAENHASPHWQRPTESEVNAAGIRPSFRDRSFQACSFPARAARLCGPLPRLPGAPARQGDRGRWGLNRSKSREDAGCIFQRRGCRAGGQFRDGAALETKGTFGKVRTRLAANHALRIRRACRDF